MKNKDERHEDNFSLFVAVSVIGDWLAMRRVAFRKKRS